MAKLKTILATALFMLMVFAGTAQATMWVTGNIVQAGGNETQAWITITPTDGQFADTRYYWLSTTNTNLMLATALSAQTSSKTASVQIDHPDQGSVCRAVLMNN